MCAFDFMRCFLLRVTSVAKVVSTVEKPNNVNILY